MTDNRIITPEQLNFGPIANSIRIELSTKGQIRLIADKPVNSIALISICSAIIQTNINELVKQQTGILNPGDGNGTQKDN